MSKKYVLAVDDSPTVLKLITGLLSSEEIIIVTCRNGEEARLEIQTRSYDLIISDEEMPELNGSDLVRWFRTENKTIPFILMSGKNDPKLFAELLSQKLITAMFPKPFQHLGFVRLVYLLLGIEETPKVKKKSN